MARGEQSVYQIPPHPLAILEHEAPMKRSIRLQLCRQNCRRVTVSVVEVLKVLGVLKVLEVLEVLKVRHL